MDPESKDADVVEETRTSESSQKRLLTVSAACVIALVLMAWFGSSRTARAKADSLQMDTAALAASMKYPLLEAASLRTDAGRERLLPEPRSHCVVPCRAAAITIARPASLSDSAT